MRKKSFAACVHSGLQSNVRPAYMVGMELKTYLDSAGLTQAAFAAKVGTTHATVSRLIAGKFLPSLTLAAAIERETNGQVPAISWASQGESAAA